MKNKLKTNYSIHPGITLKEKLDELKITEKEFQKLTIKKTGKPIKNISNILSGKDPINPEIAIQLEKTLNIPANFWIAKQSNYDKYTKRKHKKHKK